MRLGETACPRRQKQRQLQGILAPSPAVQARCSIRGPIAAYPALTCSSCCGFVTASISSSTTASRFAPATRRISSSSFCARCSASRSSSSAPPALAASYSRSSCSLRRRYSLISCSASSLACLSRSWRYRRAEATISCASFSAFNNVAIPFDCDCAR